MGPGRRGSGRSGAVNQDTKVQIILPLTGDTRVYDKALPDEYRHEGTNYELGLGTPAALEGAHLR